MNLVAVVETKCADRAAWENIVQNDDFIHPGRFPEWGAIVAQALRQSVFCVEVRDDERLVGVLPLVFMRSPLFGKHLVSLPYLNVSGVEAHDDKNREKIDFLLIDEAIRLADSLDVQYLEIRGEREVSHPALNSERREKVLMRLALPKSSQELWDGFKPKVRNQIRKAQKSNLSAEWGGRELVNDFYAVFSETMRNVGTPVYSRSLFELILERLSNSAEICVVRDPSGRIASAALLICGRNIVEVPSAGSLPWANPMCANMFLYWSLLEHSVDVRKMKLFDFGRSSVGSNVWKFKKQWGAEESPLVWKYYVRRGTIEDVRPNNASYSTAIRIWKRLPVWLTRLIGPEIVRGIP
ncbi:MAG: FemAB family PEP-CTERM system-associated protein [Planctomycetia bacterium]|nr:FemAB family PEP-CTERM system-associated protein [Planctomycetia bacterium]